MKLFVFTLSLLLLNSAKCQEYQCYHYMENPYTLFASKTVYSSVSAKENYKNPSKLHAFIFIYSKTSIKSFPGTI